MPDLDSIVIQVAGLHGVGEDDAVNFQLLEVHPAGAVAYPYLQLEVAADVEAVGAAGRDVEIDADADDVARAVIASGAWQSRTLSLLY